MQYSPNAGETWDAISYKHYGTEYYMQRLIRSNPKYNDTVIFEGTEIIEIPEIDTSDTSLQAPWRNV